MFNLNWDAGWNSDYDSTWEDDEPPKAKKQKPRYQWNRAPRDMQNYRHGYGEPNLDASSHTVYQEYMPNLAFYQNKMAFLPGGITIEEFHEYWWEHYEELEENHSFIQWLFPLRERGVNSYATPVTLAEIQMMRADDVVMRRFLASYKLMLGFYGIQLKDEKTGKVSRAENWRERFRNLNYHSHNNLRITRILKCLGEMGYGHFQAPLVRFFLEETLCENNLPNVARSVLDYFVFTVKNKEERRELVHFAWENYRSQEPFIWGPEEKLKELTLKKARGNEETAEEPDEAAGGGDVTPTGNVLHPTGSPHHSDPHQQETGTGEGGDGAAPGDHEDDACPGEAPEHEEKQITEGNSSGNEELITAGTSLGNEELITAGPSLGNEELITAGTSLGNEELITAGTSLGNEELITAGTSLGNEELITAGTSLGNEELITAGTSLGNEKLITAGTSLGNEELITAGTSLQNEELITVGTSLGNEELITAGTSLGNEELITAGTSLGNELITAGTSLGNEELITAGTCLQNEELITVGTSLGNEELITAGTSLGNEELITAGTSLGNEKLITAGTSLGNEELITAGTSLGNERQVTEGTSLGNKELITAGTSSALKNITGSTSLENKTLPTQVREPGVYQGESPKNEEKRGLLSGGAVRTCIPDRILSLFGFCCHICWCTPRS